MLKLITVNSPLILPGLGVSSSSICQDSLCSRHLTPSIRAVWAAAHNFGINNLLPLISTSCPDPSPKPQVSISSFFLGKSAWKPYRCPTLSMPVATQQTSFWQLSNANNTSATIYINKLPPYVYMGLQIWLNS